MDLTPGQHGAVLNRDTPVIVDYFQRRILACGRDGAWADGPLGRVVAENIAYGWTSFQGDECVPSWDTLRLSRRSLETGY